MTFGPSGPPPWIGPVVPVGVGDGLVGVGLGDGLVVVTVPPRCTMNSQMEYPYPVARTVPFMRTYRPLPLTLMTWLPPVPLVIVATVFQFVLSLDNCAWKFLLDAVSQLICTWQTGW